MTEPTMQNDKSNALRQAGLDHLKSGRHQMAVQYFQKALATNQNDSVSWSGIGSALEELGDTKSALTAYQNALAIDPKSFAAAHHRGRLLVKLDDPCQAIKFLERAVQINPASGAAQCDLGTALLMKGDLISAEESFQHSIALSPKFLPARINLAKCLREQHRPREAVAAFEDALEIDRKSTDVINGLASTLSDLGETKRALRILDEFLPQQSSHVEGRQNRALIQLRAGYLKEGFQDYEWRLYPSPLGVPTRPFSQPAWAGEDLGERRLLIWLEQGVGDEIMELGIWDTMLNSNKASQCVVECDPRLASLVSRSFPHVTVSPRTNPPAPAAKNTDVVCPAWSGVRLMQIDIERPKHKSKYLSADASRTRTLRNQYERLAQGRKIVGLSWGSGGRKGHLKTPPLDSWRPLVAEDSHFMVCLQYDPTAADIEALSRVSETPVYVDPTIDAKRDIDGAAAQLSALDAVVTISNSTAHLAGSLGIPVATLIASGYGGFWYWFRDRTDSPWYPSMKLCRQNEHGDWSAAMLSAQKWLKQMLRP